MAITQWSDVKPYICSLHIECIWNMNLDHAGHRRSLNQNIPKVNEIRWSWSKIIYQKILKEQKELWNEASNWQYVVNQNLIHTAHSCSSLLFISPEKLNLDTPYIMVCKQTNNCEYW